MRMAPSPRLLQVGREVKEAKLRDFVAEDIANRVSGGQFQDGTTYTLLARAPDSPVVRALLEIAGELTAARITIQAIFLDLDVAAEDRNQPTLLDKARVEFRLLSDYRFAAAHEQLVLSPAKMWLGDCMRRDPAKRDAFELFHADDAAAARYAQISFTRLWATAKPVRGATGAAPEFVIASKSAEKVRSRPASRR